MEHTTTLVGAGWWYIILAATIGIGLWHTSIQWLNSQTHTEPARHMRIDTHTCANCHTQRHTECHNNLTGDTCWCPICNT